MDRSKSFYRKLIKYQLIYPNNISLNFLKTGKKRVDLNRK